MISGDKGLLGTPVIDELRLCYRAEPSALERLTSVEEGKSMIWTPFTLYRRVGTKYKYSFIVCLGEMGQSEEVGELKFGRYGGRDKDHAYLKIYNEVLYDRDKLNLVLSLPEQMGMTLNNYTAIDIAMDFTKNTTQMVKRMMRNKQVTTIINGKAVLNRKEKLKGVCFNCPTTLDRLLRNSTITIKQVKAIKNKTRGITFQCYDKKDEIAETGKNYILNFYGNPRYLFRLEVRLPYRELQDYCARIHVTQSIETLYDLEFLRGAFFYHLSSVLRFTKGRRRISWEEVIMCNGRV